MSYPAATAGGNGPQTLKEGGLPGTGACGNTEAVDEKDGDLPLLTLAVPFIFVLLTLTTSL